MISYYRNAHHNLIMYLSYMMSKCERLLYELVVVSIQLSYLAFIDLILRAFMAYGVMGEYSRRHSCKR